jgi:ParB family chromosome partitioning protein
MEIIKIDPRECTRWKYADRHSFEFGDINVLAEDIKRNGQITPVFVRALQGSSKYKYEVIAGSRRLQACLAAEIPMDAILFSGTDLAAATIQIKENEQLTLSEYSKGLSFAKLKRDGKLTQEELSTIIGCSRKKIQNLLCFEKIDKAIWDAVSNMSKVSARSAETILALSKKSDAHKEAIIEVAEEIRKGAGSSRIERLVNEALADEFNNDDEEETITTSSGRVVAKWKKGSIFFSKNVKIDRKKLNKLLGEFFKN